MTNPFKTKGELILVSFITIMMHSLERQLNRKLSRVFCLHSVQGLLINTTEGYDRDKDYLLTNMGTKTTPF